VTKSQEKDRTTIDKNS